MKIIGCPFDNGIKSMLRFGRGVVGAVDGPEAIINFFSDNLKKNVLVLNIKKYNIDGSIEEQSLATKEAHAMVEKAVSFDDFFIGIGGDHSLTYPLFKGIGRDRKLGLVLLDAHLDMRSVEEEGIVTSGNAFWRLLEEKLIYGENFVAMGIVENNSEAFLKQKKYALSKGIKIYNEFSQIDIHDVLEIVSKDVDGVYVSIDIDVVNKLFAPGVSAQNEDGVSEEMLFAFIEEIASCKKIVAIDFMETSSRDGDEKALNKTASLVAKCIEHFCKIRFGD